MCSPADLKNLVITCEKEHERYSSVRSLLLSNLRSVLSCVFNDVILWIQLSIVKKKNGGKALKTFSFANTNDPNKYAATEFWELHVMHSFIKQIFDLAHSPIYNRNRNFSCFNIFPH